MKEDELAKRRKLKNEDLVSRMREGENLALYSPSDTFFPPRPIIKKDIKALKQLGLVADKPGE